MANKILLPNGCSMSVPSINPSNWKSGGISLIQSDWYIQYYFYDPSHPRKKKLCIVKGMNEFKELSERRNATEIILADEIRNNKKGYNPILGKVIIPYEMDSELHPNLPFMDALEIVRKKMHLSDVMKKQLFHVTERMKPMALKMKIDDVTINDISRRQMKMLLERLDLPNEYYNRFRSYLSSMFRELVEYECCDTNIIRDIRKRKSIKRERELLSPDHYKIVMEFLKSNHYTFYRYARIFGMSGSRSSELFMLQAKDVNLGAQEYKILIKKGRTSREKIKVILKAALPYWEELLKDASPEDYIFSKNLEPGAVPIKPYQITKRWYRLVKKSDKILDEEGNIIRITADFYSQKHSLLDSLNDDEAMQMAAHTNSSTTAIYQVNREKRQRELLKNLELQVN